MFTDETYARNLASLETLKASIEREYAKGRHIAVAEGRVVADAATPAELIAKLEGLGIDPRQTIGDEVGYCHPTSGYPGMFATTARTRVRSE